MITSLSWQDYFSFIGIILSLYYLAVCPLIYWNEIKGMILNKRFGAVTNNSIYLANSETRSDDEHLNLFNRLAQDSKTTITNAVAHNIYKDELLFGLKMTFKNHLDLPIPYKEALTSVVESEGIKQGNYQFTQEELDMLWRAG